MRIDAPARQKVSPSLEKAPPPALDFLPKNLYYRSMGFCTPGKDGIFEMSTRRQAKPRRKKGGLHGRRLAVRVIAGLIALLLAGSILLSVLIL